MDAIELEREGLSYAVDTVRAYRTAHPSAELIFLLGEDAAATLRPDYQASSDDNVIIQGIEGSDTSLGFVGFAFAESAGDLIKEIAVDAGAGCVAPSIETIADGTYPLSRSLYIYVNTDAAASNPALAAYVDLYVSADGLAAAAEAG